MKSAELSRTPAGAERHPWDWYVEEEWVTHRMCDFVPLESDVTYIDPCAGRCAIPRALTDRGFTAAGTDKFRRTDSSLFLFEHDFLGDQASIVEHWHPLSIVMNPPFSYQDGKLKRGLAERFVRKALGIATHKVAALLPLKWLASEGRVALFTEYPPSIFVLGERPSMPPGDQLDALGDRAFSRGKVDYVWLVWDKRAPRLAYAPTFWIPPRPPATGLELAIAAE